MWTVSSPTISFHDLACITSWPVRFSVCRVSSTSTPEGGVMASRPDCSPTIPRPMGQAATSQASVTPPALDSVLGACAVSAPPAGHRVKAAINTVNEGTRVQTRNDKVLILKFAAPKQRRHMRRGRFHAVGSLLSSKYPNARDRAPTATLPRAECEGEKYSRARSTDGIPLEQVTQRWLVCDESEGNKMPEPRWPGDRSHGGLSFMMGGS